MAVTMMRDACVGHQTRTEEARAVIWTESDEFQLKSYIICAACFGRARSEPGGTR